MADLSCAYKKTLEWCVLILYKISMMSIVCSVRCSIQKHNRALSRNIIYKVRKQCVCGLCSASTWMQGWSEVAATVRFPAMFVVIGDVQWGICVNICRVLLIWLIGLLNYDNWGWKKQLEPTKLRRQEQARKRIRDRMVPETLSDKERLKRRPFLS